MRSGFLFVILLLSFQGLFGQSLFLNFQKNYFLSYRSKNYDSYSITNSAYSKPYEVKHDMIGGAGLGLRYITGEKNISQFTFDLLYRRLYNEVVLFTDNNGGPIDYYQPRTAEYLINLGYERGLYLSDEWRFCTGLTADLLLISKRRLPEKFYISVKGKNEALPKFLLNKHYRRIIPIVPIELMYYGKKTIFSIKYEQSLINRLRGGTKQKELYGLISFNFAYRLKGKNS